MRAVIFGATGFIGSIVLERLREVGVDVVQLQAPRLRELEPDEIDSYIGSFDTGMIARHLAGADVVINVAGVAEAGSRDSRRLMAANGALPGVLAKAARSVGIPRYVHVSSAAVQGDAPELDDSPKDMGFSPYSESKVLGEHAALRYGPDGTIVFRPPSVHGPDRKITQSLIRLARSRLSCVASPGSQMTPQALAVNVGDAVRFLAVTPVLPPKIVHYPSEGITAEGLLTLLGGKRPIIIPRQIAYTSVEVAKKVSGIVPQISPHIRRLEILWLGQKQSESWLTCQGWRPPTGEQGWRSLASMPAASFGEDSANPLHGRRGQVREPGPAQASKKSILESVHALLQMPADRGPRQ